MTHQPTQAWNHSSMWSQNTPKRTFCEKSAPSSLAEVNVDSFLLNPGLTEVPHRILKIKNLYSTVKKE